MRHTTMEWHFRFDPVDRRDANLSAVELVYSF